MYLAGLFRHAHKQEARGPMQERHTAYPVQRTLTDLLFKVNEDTLDCSEWKQ